MIGAGFDEVDPDASVAAHDRIRIDSKAAEFADKCIHQRICGRQDGGKPGGLTELGQGHGDVRFTPTEGRDELRRLEKALEAGRREADHDFAKGDDGFHI